MSYYQDKADEIEYLKGRVRVLELELSDLRKRREDSQLLVAGAMRQGFVNNTQRSALLYGFMVLTGEQYERLAMLMALYIQPKGWNAPRLPKAEEQLALPPPKDEPPSHDPWGYSI